MSEQPTPATPSLYEQDETAWLEQTAALVAQRRFDEINHEHLSEYLADMARRDRREVLSRLTVLLAHLLKWEHQPDQRTSSWQAILLHQRAELRDLLGSRTLENYAREILAKAYERAVRTRPVNRRLAGCGALVAFFVEGESSWRAETRTRNGIGNRS